MNANKLLLVGAAMSFGVAAMGIGVFSSIQLLPLLPLGLLLYVLAKLAEKP